MARGFVLAAVATVLLALNLRIPTSSLGRLLPVVGGATGHGETFLSLLTTIPLALSLVISPLAPRLARWCGRNRLVGLVLVAIVVGTLL